MMDAMFPDIEKEATTIQLVVRELTNHHNYSQIERSGRASVPPATLSELEAILANEEAEIERAKRMDGQLQSLLKKVNRRP